MDGRASWELEAASTMLCHSNAAERPFAVLRQYKRMYPSLSIRNLAKLVHSIVNGTHRPAVDGCLPGSARTCDATLRRCVSTLCQVRNKTIGKITEFLRSTKRADTIEAKEVHRPRPHTSIVVHFSSSPTL
jgi:hypothetical protein